jgi:hypothetical protein
MTRVVGGVGLYRLLLPAGQGLVAALAAGLLAACAATPPSPIPPPGSVDALVRVYTAFEQAVGAPPPSSFAQTVRLVETPAGWRVARLQLLEYPDEPDEPRTPTASACRVGAPPPVWPADALPAAGGLPAWSVAVLGTALLALGHRLRSRGMAS